MADRSRDAAVASRQPVPSCTQPMNSEDREVARRRGERRRARTRATSVQRRRRSSPAAACRPSRGTCAARSAVPRSSTETPSASRLPASRPASSESPNITTMPANATAIAIHVRAGTRSLQHEPAGERREERRHAHQHEGVGDRGAGERADEEEERAGEEQAGDGARGARPRRTARGIRRPCITSSTPATNSGHEQRRARTRSPRRS